MTPRPHVSAAIVQLRLWVWFAASVIVVAAAAQLLTFGFVHYTDVRFTVLEATVEKVPAEIVRNAAALREAAPSAAATEAAPTEAARPPELNRVPNANDRAMKRAVEIASTLGVVAAVWLMMLTFMGVVVGAGASVPGIERAVTAAAWSIVLAIICLPMKDWLPSMPWRGVFGSYREMTAASEAVRSSGTGLGALLATYVGLPMVALVGGVCVGVWFRTGVERGVILTTAQQIDEALERELASVRARGVAGKASRAMGALSRTIGDPVGLPAEGRRAAGAESMASAAPAAAAATADPAGDVGSWRIGAPIRGNPEKRPI
jgi:hypothetical protein